MILVLFYFGKYTSTKDQIGCNFRYILIFQQYELNVYFINFHFVYIYKMENFL